MMQDVPSRRDLGTSPDAFLATLAYRVASCWLALLAGLPACLRTVTPLSVRK